ncbi:MAG: hypothetical protein AAF465_08795 [Pseudomonadota bacterium]
MKTLVTLLGSAAALASGAAMAHPGHEHHPFQSSLHAESGWLIAAIVVAVLVTGAVIRRRNG